MNDVIQPWLDEDFPSPHLDPVELNDLPIDDPRWISAANAKLEIRIENPHWSELPKPTRVFEPREFGDNDKSDPEQNLEEDVA